MGRAARKAETRESIKDAARDCFLSGGVSATSVGDIAARAGVAHGTFYVHFQDKEAVIDELVNEFNDALARRLDAALSAHAVGELDALVQASAVAFLDHWWANRAFVAVVAQRLGSGLPLEALRDGVNPPVREVVGRALARWTDEGHALPRPSLVLHGLLAMWARIGMQVLFQGDVTREEGVDALKHLTLGALRGVRA